MSWELASFGVLALALSAGFAWYERSRPPAKVLALVAAMAAIAVVGRIAFAPIPNVKPTTDIVLLTGYALGGAPGFCVGAVTALVSNVFFGHGPWTPWQMAAWGGVGVAGAALAALVRGRDLGRLPLALACGAAGLAFGVFMDLYLWTLAAEQTLGAYLAISSSSLTFNLAHVAGNVVFCLLIGPALVGSLRRYRRRAEVRWSPSPAAAGSTARAAGGARRAAGPAALAVALLAGLSLALPQPAAASSGDAVRYLARAQNDDGGLGPEPGSSSSQLYSGWGALGLAAAGTNPLDVAAGGRSLIDYTRRNADSLRNTGDISRTILVLEAAGASPRSFAGRDLVGELERRRRGDGSYDGLVNQTAFAILALRAAGAGGGVADSIRWIAQRQNGDGGFGFDSSRSDVDVTAAVLQALTAAGRRGSETARAALDYLEGAQRPDGGFGQDERSGSNAQSTAFAVQGLVAAGGRGGATGEALEYLRSLQADDGSVRYARGNGQTPVWVTAQALLALEREPLPLEAVAREPGGAGGDGEDRASGGGASDIASGGGDGGAAAGTTGGSGDGAHRRGGDRPEREPARGGRSGAGSLLDRAGQSEPPFDTEAASNDAPDREGGSVVGGLAAAAGSALFVFGVRRRLGTRLASKN